MPAWVAMTISSDRVLAAGERAPSRRPRAATRRAPCPSTRDAAARAPSRGRGRRASWKYSGCSPQSVPSLSKVAMRSAGGTKSGEPCFVTFRRSPGWLSWVRCRSTTAGRLEPAPSPRAGTHPLRPLPCGPENRGTFPSRPPSSSTGSRAGLRRLRSADSSRVSRQSFGSHGLASRSVRHRRRVRIGRAGFDRRVFLRLASSSPMIFTTGSATQEL